VGYGAQNIYGGFGNAWTNEGATYVLNDEDYPRYRQFYLSLDLDLTKIKTNNYFLKSLLSLANLVKIPAPTLEVNTIGQVKFHALHF